MRCAKGEATRRCSLSLDSSIVVRAELSQGGAETHTGADTRGGRVRHRALVLAMNRHRNVHAYRQNCHELASTKRIPHSKLNPLASTSFSIPLVHLASSLCQQHAVAME